jgi:Domain of unknown function (DUF4274)
MKLNFQQQWRVSKALLHPEYYVDLRTPEEVHAFVNLWNWDLGCQELSDILDGSYCDRGTALMMYWRGGAGFYRQYSSIEEVPGHAQEGYEFILKVRKALEENDFSSEQFTFETQYELNQYDDVDQKWDHPESAKIPVIGEDVESESDSYYAYTIIESLSEELVPILGTINLEPQTHDCSDEAVWFWAGEGKLRYSGMFDCFQWDNLKEDKGIEFSLEFTIFLTISNIEEPRYIQVYSTRAENISSAIKNILYDWSCEFLAFLNAIPKQSLYKEIRVNNQNINCLCWSIGSALPNTDPQFMTIVEEVLQSYSLPITIKFMPDQTILVFSDDTGYPYTLPSSALVDKPNIMILI